MRMRREILSLSPRWDVVKQERPKQWMSRALESQHPSVSKINEALKYGSSIERHYTHRRASAIERACHRSNSSVEWREISEETLHLGPTPLLLVLTSSLDFEARAEMMKVGTGDKRVV